MPSRATRTWKGRKRRRKGRPRFASRMRAIELLERRLVLGVGIVPRGALLGLANASTCRPAAARRTPAAPRDRLRGRAARRRPRVWYSRYSSLRPGAGLPSCSCLWPRLSRAHAALACAHSVAISESTQAERGDPRRAWCRASPSPASHAANGAHVPGWRGGRRRRTAELPRVAADLVECDEPVIAIEARVLHPFAITGAVYC